MLALLLACARPPEVPREVRFNRSGEVPVSATAAREVVLVPVIMSVDRDWERLPVTGTARVTVSVADGGASVVASVGDVPADVVPGSPLTRELEVRWRSCEPLRGCFAEIPLRLAATTDTTARWAVDLSLRDPGRELRVGIDVR